MHDPFLGRRMSAKCFAEWMWYEDVEPFGELREDYRTAQIVAMLYNIAVPEKDQKDIKSFLLKFEAAGSKKQTANEQIMILNALAAAFSGE